MAAQFWRDKRVFITGHTGFKGSWLTLWLHRWGAKVYGYSLPAPTSPSLFHLARLQTCAQTIIGDVRDTKHLSETMASVQPDIVFHLAAQPLLREMDQTPIDTFSTNIMGTAHLLEAVRHTPSVRAVVIVTSDKCYENREWLWGYREDDPMGGHDPYSSSKGAVELITSAFRRTYFSKDPENCPAVATVRAGNIIGGGDFSADSLIPDFIRVLEKQEAINIRNPHAIRPWQFVLEPLSGYMQVAQRLYEAGHTYATGWNFGPADTDLQTVAQLCATFNHSLQKHDVEPIEIRLEAGIHSPQEEAFLRLDISKARQRLNWIPKLELYSALELTAQWYAGYINNEDLRSLSESQIDFYQNLT